MQRKLKKQQQKLLPVFMTLIIFAVVISVAPKLFAKESPVSLNEQQEIIKIGDKLIDVPNICQYPSLPTGCESAAAAMVLQYHGCSVTAEDFADRWLERSDDFYSDGNTNYYQTPTGFLPVIRLADRRTAAMPRLSSTPSITTARILPLKKSPDIH